MRGREEAEMDELALGWAEREGLYRMEKKIFIKPRTLYI